MAKVSGRVIKLMNEDVIEEAPQQRKKTGLSWSTRILLFFGQCMACLAFLAFLLYHGGRYVERGLDIAQGTYEEKKMELALWLSPPVGVPSSPTVPGGDSGGGSFDTVIEAAAKEYGLPPLVLKAVAMQESNGGHPEAMYAFEEGMYTRPGFQQKYKKLSPNERRAMASSHGPLHTMGFNAQPRCGVHWHQLYDMRTGTRCGAKILKAEWERFAHVKEKKTRLFLTFRAYNGDIQDPRTEAYAQSVMGHLGALLAEGVISTETRKG